MNNQDCNEVVEAIDRLSARLDKRDPDAAALAYAMTDLVKVVKELTALLTVMCNRM